MYKTTIDIILIITNIQQKEYRGRFAPSPSGELHFGSLLAAMASYADARSHHGKWLIRIDDIDQARVVNGSEQHLLQTLEQCGFSWDETVSHQSHHLQHYQQAIAALKQQQQIYPCSCSRKQLKALGVDQLYPGFCRHKKITELQDNAIRIKLTDEPITFNDIIQGRQQQQLALSSGDFIIYRRDNVFSYQLSVVVDDFLCNISHVIRGYDLLESTAKQIYLQQLLNYPRPCYAHIPLAVNTEQLKLSKLCQAKKINCDVKTLVQAARFLGQKISSDRDFDSIDDFWQYLIAHWDINRVAKMEKQVIMY